MTDVPQPMPGYPAVAMGLGVALASAPSARENTANPFATADELGLMKGFPPPPDKRVDRSNAIFAVPYNRWAYQNIRKIFPTARIRAADTPVTLDRNIAGGMDDLSVKRENGKR